jgi:protein-tyrosine phosphatase
MEKTGVLFVCHGNICRSTMAESVFSHLLKKEVITNIAVSSAATHTDEIGNPPHYGTREKLRREQIPLVPHRARLLQKSDAETYRFIVGMDEENLRHMHRILGAENQDKISLLLDYGVSPRPIADPWFTGNFDETYDDVLEGCRGLLLHLRDEGLI